MELLDMNRRDVLKSLAAMTAAIMVPTAFSGCASQAIPGSSAIPMESGGRDRFGELLPRRKLGRTGAMVTMLGIGGGHLGRMNEAEAQKALEAAVEGGVRFVDTSAAYQAGAGAGGGGSETRLGKMLTPRYRDVMFLSTKTLAADGASARKHLDESLTRLKTDYLDLWQMHELMSAKMTDQRLAGGVLEAFMEAKAKGKVKHIGFTGYATPASHVRMLERMKGKGDLLETCQMPVNATDPSYNSFILKVLPTAMARGYGVCAIRTLAGGGFTVRGSTRVVPNLLSVDEALQFVWSLPVSVLITGSDNAEQMRQAIAAAKRFREIDEAGRKALIAKVAGVAGRGVEYYKV